MRKASLSNNLEQTLLEREQTHGDFNRHALIAQSIKCQMFNAHGYGNLNACQRESLDMIAHKIARILNGNPNVHDHWHDIAGYATLVAKELNETR